MSTFLVNKPLHVLGNVRIPLRHRHVKPVIHARLGSFLHPGLVPGCEVSVDGKREVDVHGSAPRQRCGLATEEVVDGFLAHEWHLHVCVRVYAT